MAAKQNNTEEASPAWRKQFSRERKYDDDFEKAGNGKSLKGGIYNAKNWRGGEWEATHSPYEDRKKLEAKDAKKKISTQENKPSTKKTTDSKKATKKVVTTKR
jgi:hypothetical protein